MKNPTPLLDWSIPRIYSASKIWHANKWLNLRSKGFNINSSWIDIPCGTPENKGSAKTLNNTEKQNLWLKVMREVSSCDLLIIYSEPGEVQNGGLVEMSHAMAFNKPVYTIGLAENMKVSPNSDCAFMQYPCIYQFSFRKNLVLAYKLCLEHYLYSN